MLVHYYYYYYYYAKRKKLANHLLSLNLRAALDQEVRSSVLPTLSSTKPKMFLVTAP